MKIPELPDVAVGHVIPRFLHHIYFRPGEPGAAMPNILRRNVDELVEQNPQWEHRLWNEAAMESFIEEHYGPAVLDCYRRIDPAYGAARADLFRYLALYRLGGVYLDVKSRFSRPIDEVLRRDEHFVVSRWRNELGEIHAGWGRHPEYGGVNIELQQWHVIAAPGHPFLKAAIEEVLSRIGRYAAWSTGVGDMGVFRVTGPIAYTQAIVPILDRHPCTIIDDETAIGLEFSILDGLEHRSLFKTHYTGNMSPVVRRAGVGRWLDLAYTRARTWKHRWRARKRRGKHVG